MYEYFPWEVTPEGECYNEVFVAPISYSLRPYNPEEELLQAVFPATIETMSPLASHYSARCNSASLVSAQP